MEAPPLNPFPVAHRLKPGAKQQRRIRMLAVRFLLVVLLLLAASAAHATAAKATMKPFASEAELQALLKSWREQFERRRTARAESYGMQSALPGASPMSAAKVAEADAITNVQHAGVDEGGIVKHQASTSSSCAAAACSR
jgi:uncharacterized secreted protein with C-terminal beta-propeller domain